MHTGTLQGDIETRWECGADSYVSTEGTEGEAIVNLLSAFPHTGKSPTRLKKRVSIIRQHFATYFQFPDTLVMTFKLTINQMVIASNIVVY